MQKLISQVVLGIGIMVAVTAAAKLPTDGQNFPDTWHYAVVGMGISLVGVILWHGSERHDVADESLAGSATEEIDDPLKRIRQMSDPLNQLAGIASQLSIKDLQDGIDELLDKFVLPVTDARRQILATLGIQAAAELLIDFSAVERKLNRAWSAAGDGNLPEAVASIQDAKTAYTSMEGRI